MAEQNEKRKNSFFQEDTFRHFHCFTCVNEHRVLRRASREQCKCTFLSFKSFDCKCNNSRLSSDKRRNQCHSITFTSEQRQVLFAFRVCKHRHKQRIAFSVFRLGFFSPIFPFHGCQRTAIKLKMDSMTWYRHCNCHYQHHRRHTFNAVSDAMKYTLRSLCRSFKS